MQQERETLFREIEHTIENFSHSALNRLERMGVPLAHINIGKERQLFIRFHDGPGNTLPTSLANSKAPESEPLAALQQAVQNDLTEMFPGHKLKLSRKRTHSSIDPTSGKLENHYLWIDNDGAHYIKLEFVQPPMRPINYQSYDHAVIASLRKHAPEFGLELLASPRPAPILHPAAGHINLSLSGQFGQEWHNLFHDQDGMPNKLFFLVLEKIQHLIDRFPLLLFQNPSQYEQMAENPYHVIRNGLSSTKGDLGMSVRGGKDRDNDLTGENMRLELRAATGGLPWRLDGMGWQQEGGSAPSLATLLVIRALDDALAEAMSQGAYFSKDGKIHNLKGNAHYHAFYQRNREQIEMLQTGYPGSFFQALQVFDANAGKETLLARISEAIIDDVVFGQSPAIIRSGSESAKASSQTVQPIH